MGWRGRGRVRTLVHALTLLALLQLTLILYSSWSVLQSPFDEVPSSRDPLTYSPPWDVTLRGKRFDNVSMETLESLTVPSYKWVTLTPRVLAQFVIVVPSNAVYFPRAVDAIATAQKYFPDHKIILYDLGHITKHYPRQVEQLCGVEYRQFDFSKYPEHVKTLQFYAWKALIIAEVLQDHPGVFMMDSSLRFTRGGGLGAALSAGLVATGGVLGLSLAGHSNFATTHPGMYAYLPTDTQGMQESEQMESGSVFFFRTKTTIRHVLHWSLLCALQRMCIAPTSKRGCNLQRTRTEYADCHRFDQSALNIILANLFGFDHEKYVAKEELVRVRRFAMLEEEVAVCGAGGRTTMPAEQFFPGKILD